MSCVTVVVIGVDVVVVAGVIIGVFVVGVAMGVIAGVVGAIIVCPAGGVTEITLAVRIMGC